MSIDTTRIELPPPKMIRKRKRPRVPRNLWILLLILALIAGVVAGIDTGLRYKDSRKAKKTTVEVGGGEQSKTTKSPSETDEEVYRLIASARVAVNEGDWYRARILFNEVLKLEPENPDALASLPLIDRRLNETRGTLVIKTNPPGAEVKVVGFQTKKSPVEFDDVPVGSHSVVISKPGYETVTREVSLAADERLEVPSIPLSKSAGKLEVVSEPKGAEFKVIKKQDDELKELIQTGTTPAMLEKLDAGEYQVLMAVEGWPEYSEFIRIEHNRNSSVSAVFAEGGLNVTSDPNGAEIWLKSPGKEPKRVGVTPSILSALPVGRHQLELRFKDWDAIKRTVEVEEGVTQELKFAWERSLVTFISDPPGAGVFQGDQRVGNGLKITPFTYEFPEGEYTFTARHRTLGDLVKPVLVEGDESEVVNFEFDYGSVILRSEPEGAAVISNGVPLGRTPLSLPYVKPGNYSYELSKEDHRKSVVSGILEPGGSLEFNTKLKYDASPAANRHFDNGLGQRMIWFGNLNGWVASTETTQEQYERVTGKNPSYFKDPKHPVDTITWYDAAKYCEGLTVQEQGLGNLPAGYRYRLPTDAEWTQFAGNAKLDQAITSVFNRQQSTAPVASLPSNEFGLFDVRGNVMEWCQDWYSQSVMARTQREGGMAQPSWIGTDRKVLRGGSWNRSSQYDLEISNRVAARPSDPDRYDIGFRVVLMKDQ